MVQNQKIVFAVLFIFLLNLILGLVFINQGIFHHDAVSLAQAVEKTFQTKLLQPELACRGRYGAVILTFFISLPWLILAGSAEFAVRFSSVLFQALSVVALFFFVKDIFKDSLQAFFTSLFLSFTPFYFLPNTWGKEHGASIFFMLAAFLILKKGLDKSKPALLAFSGLVFIFAVTIRESILVMLPFFIWFFFKISKRFLRPKELLNFFLPLLGSLAIIYLLYLSKDLRGVLKAQGQENTLFLGIFSPVLLLAGRDINIAIPSIIFAFFILGFIFMLKDKLYFKAFFFFAWALTFFYFGNVSSYISRYLDLPIIAVYILAAYFLSKYYRRFSLVILLVVLLITAGMFANMYPLLKFRHNYNGEKQFALFVNESTPKNAIIIAMDDCPFIEYYGKRKCVTYPLNDPARADNFVSGVKVCLKKQRAVYILESSLGYDHKGIFKKRLYGNFNLNLVGEKLTEDYHRPELKFCTYQGKLYKLTPKK